MNKQVPLSPLTTAVVSLKTGLISKSVALISIRVLYTSAHASISITQAFLVFPVARDRRPHYPPYCSHRAPVSLSEILLYF